MSFSPRERRGGIVILVILTRKAYDDCLRREKRAPHRITRQDTWSVATAKAQLSEVVARAQGRPQLITRNGKPAAVVVSAEEWARKTTRKGTLAEFLLASPLSEAPLDLERQHDNARDVAL